MDSAQVVVANLSEMDESTRNDYQISTSRSSIQNDEASLEWWKQRAQDRQAHKDFLEDRRGTDKFSGKYAPQPQQKELILTLLCGCWIELEDKDMYCEEWECMIEILTEEDANTTVQRIYGQRATLCVNYKPGDWDGVRALILKAGS